MTWTRPTAQSAAAALALWREQALDEFTDVAPLSAEAAGLAELTGNCATMPWRHGLAAGERAVTADVASAAGEDPLRERTATC